MNGITTNPKHTSQVNSLCKRRERIEGIGSVDKSATFASSSYLPHQGQNDCRAARRSWAADFGKATFGYAPGQLIQFGDAGRNCLWTILLTKAQGRWYARFQGSFDLRTENACRTHGYP